MAVRVQGEDQFADNEDDVIYHTQVRIGMEFLNCILMEFVSAFGNSTNIWI